MVISPALNPLPRSEVVSPTIDVAVQAALGATPVSGEGPASLLFLGPEMPATPSPIIASPATPPFGRSVPNPTMPQAGQMGEIDWAALAAASSRASASPLPPGSGSGLFATPLRVPAAPLRPTALPELSSEPVAFALFSSLAQTREAPPEPPRPAGSTLSRLRHVVAHSGEAFLPHPVFPSAAAEHHRFAGGVGVFAGGTMPAAAVTVPLGEVMRLIAEGGLPAVTPIDTFRAALRSSSPF